MSFSSDSKAHKGLAALPHQSSISLNETAPQNPLTFTLRLDPL